MTTLKDVVRDAITDRIKNVDYLKHINDYDKEELDEFCEHIMFDVKQYFSRILS